MSSSRPSTSRPVPQQQHTGPRSDMNGPRRLQASQELHPVGDGWSNSHVGHRLDSRMAEYHDWTLSTTSAKTSFHRHDYRLEPMPQQPMYHPAFDRAELACMDIVRKIASKIKDIGDAHLAALLASKMHEAGTIHHSIPELVGFFGMTGQGKSTAVGLLLGDKRLIKEGSGGESVTRLPIVYTFRQEPDTSPYEALVTVCDPPTCRDSVKAHVTDVIAELDAGRSLENDQDQISTSNEMLKGLFADVPAFKSDAALITYLTHSKHDGQDVYKECIAWADERRRAVMRNTHSVLRAADPQALWEQLAPYAGISLGRADEKSLEFDPSSLVARIRISSATRLRLSLGDFPGLGDIDRDRITKAQRQLELCDTIIVAEDVSRAASSDFLLGFLIECYRRRPETQIIVALTKCEKDINVTNRLNTTFDLSQTRDLNYLEERKARAEQHLEAIPSTAYTEEYRRLKFEMKCIDLEQRSIFARERSQRTARKLAARYAERTNGRHLRIFPLSSAAYDTNICGYDQIKVDTLPLSVTASGFPALIYELADIPCARIQRDMRRYTETTLPDLLSFIELCSMSQLLDRNKV